MLLLLVGRSSLGKRYRARRRSWNHHDSQPEEELLTKRGLRKRWWKEADSWPLNAVVGGVGAFSCARSSRPRKSSCDPVQVLTIGTVLIWYLVDVRERVTTPPLEPIKAPFDRISWAGWAIGFAGLLCYSASIHRTISAGHLTHLINPSDVPRWYQIYKIHRNRSMEHISLFMFAWLLAQNVTMLAVSDHSIRSPSIDF